MEKERPLPSPQYTPTSDITPTPQCLPPPSPHTGGQYSLPGPYGQTLLIALDKKVVVPCPLKNLKGKKKMVEILCSYAL